MINSQKIIYYQESLRNKFARLFACTKTPKNKHRYRKFSFTLKQKLLFLVLCLSIITILIFSQIYSKFISIETEINFQYIYETECNTNSISKKFLSTTKNIANRFECNADWMSTNSITLSFIIVSRNDYLEYGQSLKRLKNLILQLTQFQWQTFRQSSNAVYVELIIVEWNAIETLPKISEQLQDLRNKTNIIVRWITVSSEVHSYLMSTRFGSQYKYYCKTCKFHEWIAKNAAAYRACGKVLIFLTSDSMPSIRLLSYLSRQTQDETIIESDLKLHPNNVFISSRPDIILQDKYFQSNDHRNKRQCPCVLPTDISNNALLAYDHAILPNHGENHIITELYAESDLKAWQCHFFPWHKKYGNTAPGEWQLIFKSAFARIGGYMEAPQIAHVDSEFVSRLQNVYHLNVLGLSDDCIVYHQDHQRPTEWFNNRVKYDGCNMLMSRLESPEKSLFVQPIEYTHLQERFTFSRNYKWINEKTWGLQNIQLPEVRWTPMHNKH